MREGGHHGILKYKTQLLIITVILLFAGAVTFGLIKTGVKPEKIERENPGALVAVEPAQPISKTMVVEAFGTVEARREVTETSEVSGKITFASEQLEEGMFFKKGDLLIEIDPRNYELAVKRAEAELARLRQEQKNNEANLKLAEEELALSERELQRQENLRKTNVATESTVESAKMLALNVRTKKQTIENTLATLESQIAAAEANLAEAQLNLERTHITAPFDGRTMEKMIEQGQFVTMGTPMAKLYDTSSVEVTVQLPYEDLRWIDLSAATALLRQNREAGDDVELAKRPNATATLETGGQDYSWTGFLSRVKGMVEQSTRTVPVVVEFPNPWKGLEESESNPPLVPGMFVRVQIEGRRYDKIYEVPRMALRGVNLVYVAEDGKLRERKVRVLREMNNTAWIEAGLNEGDQIITSPMGAALDGMAVRVAEETETREPNLTESKANANE